MYSWHRGQLGQRSGAPLSVGVQRLETGTGRQAGGALSLLRKKTLQRTNFPSALKRSWTTVWLQGREKQEEIPGEAPPRPPSVHGYRCCSAGSVAKAVQYHTVPLEWQTAVVVPLFDRGLLQTVLDSNELHETLFSTVLARI